MALQQGAVFAGYRIERLLGVGGMGEVYLAQHPHLPRQDALKVLPAHLCDHDEYRQRFLVEANLACRLRHPNIVGIHDRGEYDDRLWISMDYIDGRNLEDAIREDGRFPFDRALQVMSGIASAVEDLHDAHLLHRDIKPANILITSRRGVEKAYLTDFGIARDAADTLGLTTTSQAVLTLAYAAPERLSLPSDQLDRRVDVFSLGCVCYEMLTGRRAFPGVGAAQVIHQVMHENPPPASQLVPGLPPTVDFAISRAIAKDRDQRFDSCFDFLHALESTVRSTTPALRPELPLTVSYRGEGLQPVWIHSDQLAPQERDRLQALLTQTGFLQLGPVLPSTNPGGGRREFGVQASNAANTVTWQGEPPIPVAALRDAVVEIAGRKPPKPPKPSRKKPWLIATAATVAVLAGAAIALVLLWPNKPPTPAIPANVTAQALPGSVRVSWLPTANADHYVVYRDDKVVGADVAQSSYVDMLGNDMSRHSYSVMAVSAKGKQSAQSVTVQQAAALRNLNPAEASLVARLPGGLVLPGSCTPDIPTEQSSAADAKIDASIVCSPASFSGVITPSQKLRAYHAVSQTAYQNNVNRNESGLPANTHHQCASGTPTVGSWFDSNNVTRGDFYCFFTKDGSAPALAWTTAANQDILEIFNAEGSGANGLTLLYNYWANLTNRATS